ncbi:DSD1 family PLP-dependent enzyme [bacterium]|nr:DSD1 family PLP-dependent enzyme [bacterium]
MVYETRRYEVGLTIPAEVGMSLDDVHTPALIIDLDAFENNVRQMGAFARKNGIRHRAHAKTHKSVDIARIQMELGGAVGICCQKVSEAEVMINGGINDVLVSNQIVDPRKIERLARLANKARLQVCVDDGDNVAELSKAAVKHQTELACLVEIDCGSGRCGVQSGFQVVELAERINSAPGLVFKGLQAYQGAAQHIRNFDERGTAVKAAIRQVSDTIQLLNASGLLCDIVSGAGTGSYYFEAGSGVYNELQCGSYVFMDADYQRVQDAEGDCIHEFENSLFLLTAVMSKTRRDKAICDAGLKVQSVDSGLPYIFNRDDIEYIKCSDEHGEIADPHNHLKLNDRLLLVPGHCDPTCNIHDWYVGIRHNRVECLWPVSARGMAY